MHIKVVMRGVNEAGEEAAIIINNNSINESSKNVTVKNGYERYFDVGVFGLTHSTQADITHNNKLHFSKTPNEYVNNCQHTPNDNRVSTGIAIDKVTDRHTNEKVSLGNGTTNLFGSEIYEEKHSQNTENLETYTARRFTIQKLQQHACLCIEYCRSWQCKSILSAVLFAFFSMMSTFTNKLVMTTYGFDYPVIIMLCQMVVVLVIIQTLSVVRAITLEHMTLSSLKLFLVPALCFAFYTSLSLSALSHMNVALYTMVRRTIPLCALVLGIPLLQNGWPSVTTILSVNLLSWSCVVAGYGDLNFSAIGYASVMGSNVAQAVYFIFIQKHCESSTITDVIHHNAVLAIPILIMVAAVKGELSSVTSYQFFDVLSFKLVFSLQMIVGASLSAAVILCTGNNCALTTCIVGSIKAMIQTLIGLVTFEGVEFSVYVCLGLLMNLLGSCIYIYSKCRSNRNKQRRDSVDVPQCVDV